MGFGSWVEVTEDSAAGWEALQANSYDLCLIDHILVADENNHRMQNQAVGCWHAEAELAPRRVPRPVPGDGIGPLDSMVFFSGGQRLHHQQRYLHGDGKKRATADPAPAGSPQMKGWRFTR